ncbi:MAG: ABC transporter permease [Coriobacteriia bacterium]|nr:ABC transporter permease [Coriobacteriia bacterium]
MNLKKLPLQNLVRHSGRTIGLAAIVALLTCAVYGGALVVSSLQSGLNSLEARLGADIVVAPATARSQYDLNEVLVEGVPSSFYMDKAYVAKVAQREGVEIATPQYFLATMKAGCCAMPVQIIGFDPETDFTVKPWIARTYGGELGMLDIIAGCNISGGVGDQIQFYGETCTIVAKLAETGTSMDNAVYGSGDTVKHLVEAAVDLGFSPLAHEDPQQVVSTIMVKVADGHSVEEVLGDIKLHVRGVSAVATRTMTSDVADSVAGMSGVIQVVFGIIGVLAVIVLVVAFLVVGRHRTREFAVLRVLGASKRMLSGIVVKEAAIISAAGALVGVAIALVVVLSFNGALESALGLPFLLPVVATIALLALGAFALAMVAGCGASFASATRLSKVDPGQTLREE